jgi:lipopolysaccharide/colanic/teichoic acid biosynthesis glycosyltransferase
VTSLHSDMTPAYVRPAPALTVVRLPAAATDEDRRVAGPSRLEPLTEPELAQKLVDSSRAQRAYNRFGKPVVDRIGALILLLAFAPVIALVAVAVFSKLGRPLFIRQQRIGRDGEVFEMLKFRTMEPCRRQRQAPPPTGVDRRTRHKTVDDPRHTDLGRFLRRYSLDELPQILNVLKGDMSLIGPRPEMRHIVAGYAGWQHHRHQVKPGITGLWQVTERSTSDGDMHLHTEVDLVYIARLSLLTDLRILFKTLPAALGKGN